MNNFVMMIRTDTVSVSILYIYHIYHIIIYIIYQISFIIYHISEPSLTDCHTTFLLAFSQDTHVEIGGSETYPI